MKNKKLLILILDAILIVFGLTAGKIADFMMAYHPECVFARMGITCPSCGGTRCVRAFFRGQFLDSFLYHPFFFLLIIYLGIALVLFNVGYLAQNRLSERIARGMVHRNALLTLAAIYAVFGITRMIILLIV